MEITVKVRELIGSQCCIAQDDGQSVFDKIHDQLKNGGVVVLDFEGMKIHAAPFYNFAIGQLFRDIPEKTINENLSYKNIDVVGQSIIRRAIENADSYYHNSQL